MRATSGSLRFIATQPSVQSYICAMNIMCVMIFEFREKRLKTIFGKDVAAIRVILQLYDLTMK